MYAELARWFHLITSPEEYAEEASVYTRLLDEACSPREVLELGSGGGNNASHMKAHYSLTLTDLSPEMLELSATINPECEHVLGDMRTVRLGRTFDAVFIHDAVAYMCTEGDLRQAIATAAVHCKPGGAALFVPDYTRETFRVGTDHGGFDGDDGRALRYLEWVWDPDPDDGEYTADYAYVMREPDGSVTVERDRHIEGLFDRATWLRLLDEAGFEAKLLPLELSDLEPGQQEMFLGMRRPTSANPSRSP